MFYMSTSMYIPPGLVDMSGFVLFFFTDALQMPKTMLGIVGLNKYLLNKWSMSEWMNILYNILNIFSIDDWYTYP